MAACLVNLQAGDGVRSLAPSGFGWGFCREMIAVGDRGG